MHNSGANIKLLICVNVDWFFLSHRLPLALAAKEQGYEVHIAAADTGKGKEIEDHGLIFHALPISRSGTSPLSELKSLKAIYSLYKRLKPEIIHQVSMKPVIYGSIVTRLFGIRTINAISGMGYIFTKGRISLVQALMKQMMKWGWNQKMHLIFQNEDDLAQCRELGLLNTKIKPVLIKGSGVDLNLFQFSDLPANNPLKIVFPARMLHDKGLVEFIEAAQILAKKWSGKILFQLAGMVDKENPTNIQEEELRAWEVPGYIEWLGFVSDMRSLYKTAELVVLPSYREGLPKSLIEAMAIGRPIITTDTIGCREVVQPNYNGLLVPIMDGKALANAIEQLLISRETRVEMGLASRKMAEEEFSLEGVILKHLELYAGEE